MPTLSEYAKLANDEVLGGVYENIITADAMSAMLQFQSFEGNSLKYNRENALPTSVTHAVGDTWEDTEATYTPKSAELSIFGIQSPLDRYVLQTRGNVQSQEAVLFAGMGKSLSRKIGDQVITGNSGTTATEMEGLTSLLIADTRFMLMDDGNVDVPVAGAETELTLDRLDSMIDLVEKGKPHALIMNKTMRRKLTSISRATGSGVLMDTIDMFGHQLTTYDGIPIIITDFITNSEQYENSGSWGSSTATTIFAVKFGEEAQGYTLIHNGPVLDVDIQRLGIKEKKNENAYRMVAYLGAVLYSAKMCAGLAGIDSAA